MNFTEKRVDNDSCVHQTICWAVLYLLNIYFCFQKNVFSIVFNPRFGKSLVWFFLRTIFFLKNVYLSSTITRSDQNTNWQHQQKIFVRILFFPRAFSTSDISHFYLCSSHNHINISANMIGSLRSQVFYRSFHLRHASISSYAYISLMYFGIFNSMLNGLKFNSFVWNEKFFFRIYSLKFKFDGRI